jgi:hypothetical protein
MKIRIYTDNGKVFSKPEKNHKAPGILRVFVTDNRPNGDERPGMGNIMADFAWRRSVKMTDIKTNPDFKKAIAEYLQKPVDGLVFRFNRNCGCSMCPCSPGILVQEANVNYHSSYAPEIWIDIANDDQDIDQILADKKAASVKARKEYEAKEAIKKLNENVKLAGVVIEPALAV